MFAPLSRRLLVLALASTSLAGGCACARQDHVWERVREREHREWNQLDAASKQVPAETDPTTTDREVWEERARREAEFRSGVRR